ncbi:oligosaccharide flippase family protein [Vibrio cholerae]
MNWVNHKKEIIKNIISYGAIDILGLLIPLLTMPILTRALGAEQYGFYMFLLTIIYFGHTIIDYGTQYTSVRELAKYREDIYKIKRVYQDTQGLRFFLFIAYCIGIIFYSFILNFDSITMYILFISLTYLLGYTLSPVWFYQGIGEVEIAMKVSLVVKITNLTTIILIVDSPNDLKLVVASLCIPMLLGGLYLSYFAMVKYQVGFPKFRQLKKSLYVGRDVFIGLLAPNFYNAIPTIALGSIYPPADFASFAIASRLASVIVTVQNVVAKSIYPVLSIVKSNPINKLLLINFIISIIPLIIIYVVGDWLLIIFLGDGFLDVNKYLMILCFGIVFIGLSNAISQGYLLPNGYDRIYRNISLRVSIVSGLVSFMLIYFYGIFGGAIAITIARIFFFLDYFQVYIKHK